ncbi:MAG TPA: nuclear transport factor 2 family protein [Acidisphaera sp.]|nr:nuclear transport factor 2 family protein [Acidisphaera sp.]
MTVPYLARAAMLAVAVGAVGASGLHAQPSSSTAAVLAVNDAFYKALSARDPVAMAKVWAHESFVANGSPRSTDVAIGWPAVDKTFQGLPAHFQKLEVTPSDAYAYVNGKTAWVFDKEHAVGTLNNEPIDWTMSSVNVFQKFGAQWLMVAHHVGAPVK